MKKNNDIEIWKDIKGFKGYYKISNFGRVKQLERETIVRNRLYHVDEKIMTPFTWQNDYLRVELRVRRNKKTKRRATYIHTLVCETFIGERPNGYVIDHIDRNKHNNRVDNLRYVTIKENRENVDKNMISEKQKLSRAKYDTPEYRQKISDTLKELYRTGKKAKPHLNKKRVSYIDENQKVRYKYV